MVCLWVGVVIGVVVSVVVCDEVGVVVVVGVVVGVDVTVVVGVEMTQCSKALAGRSRKPNDIAFIVCATSAQFELPAGTNTSMYAPT